MRKGMHMRKLAKFITKLHRDDRGAEGLEKLLIIAAIVLPLLALLIYFREWISEWVVGESDTVRQDSAVQDPF